VDLKQLTTNSDEGLVGGGDKKNSPKIMKTQCLDPESYALLE